MVSSPGDPTRKAGEDEDPPLDPLDPDDGLSELAKAYRAVGPFLHLGWTLAASLTFLTLGGSWLDKTWGTTPWLTLTGALLGISGGMLHLFRSLKHLDK